MVDALKQFNEADWPQITLKLVKYALFKVRRLEWSTGDFLPKGLLPEDIALEAIRKTCEGLAKGQSGKSGKGVRNWEPEAYPDLLEFLKSVVDSDVHALVESLEHKTSNYSSAVSPEEAAAITAAAIDAQKAEDDSGDTLERREAEAEMKKKYDDLMKRLYKACAGNEEELLVLMAYQEAAKSGEPVRPALVARYSGLEERTARNAMRRLARHMEKERIYEKEREKDNKRARSLP